MAVIVMSSRSFVSRSKLIDDPMTVVMAMHDNFDGNDVAAPMVSTITIRNIYMKLTGSLEVGRLTVAIQVSDCDNMHCANQLFF